MLLNDAQKAAGYMQPTPYDPDNRSRWQWDEEGYASVYCDLLGVWVKHIECWARVGDRYLFRDPATGLHGPLPTGQSEWLPHQRKAAVAAYKAGATPREYYDAARKAAPTTGGCDA